MDTSFLRLGKQASEGCLFARHWRLTSCHVVKLVLKHMWRCKFFFFFVCVCAWKLYLSRFIFLKDPAACCCLYLFKLIKTIFILLWLSRNNKIYILDCIKLKQNAARRNNGFKGDFFF